MFLRKPSLRSAGSFKTSLLLLYTNSKKVVTEISKFASGSLQLQNEPVEEGEAVDDGGGHVPGIMDEVLITFFTEILVMLDRSTDFPTTLDHGKVAEFHFKLNAMLVLPIFFVSVALIF
ncbi:unnamed protein product [Malus baccata var. baccata]